jgi:3-phenylpropionate/trans-cinnamate dioxygenase ferredoxin subunit
MEKETERRRRRSVEVLTFAVSPICIMDVNLETPLQTAPDNSAEPAFVSVADVESLPPGQGRTVHVKGREFAIYNLDGQFYAIDDKCSHRGGPLGAGVLEDGQVFCPMHGWAFDLRTGACHSNPARPVKSYPTRVVDGQVQILI